MFLYMIKISTPIIIVILYAFIIYVFIKLYAQNRKMLKYFIVLSILISIGIVWYANGYYYLNNVADFELKSCSITIYDDSQDNAVLKSFDYDLTKEKYQHKLTDSLNDSLVIFRSFTPLSKLREVSVFCTFIDKTDTGFFILNGSENDLFFDLNVYLSDGNTYYLKILVNKNILTDLKYAD